MSNYKYLSYSKLLEDACFMDMESPDHKEIRINRVDIQDARIKYWGSFLQCLWHALAHADPINSTRIIDEFQDYIIQFYIEWLLNKHDWKSTS